MKRNQNYYLAQINNVDYLIPFGQAIEDYPHAISLNPTGKYLWDVLETSHSYDELLSEVIHHFNPSKEDFCGLKEDISSFITDLKSKGLITSDSKDFISSQLISFINIAGIKIGINLDNQYLDSKLQSFSCNPFNSDEMNLYVEISSEPAFPKKNGTILLRNTSSTIIETENEYVYILHGYLRIREIHLKKTYNQAIFFTNGLIDDVFAREFYVTLRTPFLFTALSQNMLMLHSSSILYNGKLYCFSAPSGTGKSTHANLWATIYDVPVINGDLNLLEVFESHVLVHGTPWCGTSNIYSANTYELGGIFFLQRSEKSKASYLDEKSSIIKLFSRIISPAWTKGLSEFIMILSTQICSICPHWILDCSMENSSAEVSKAAIDAFTNTYE